MEILSQIIFIILVLTFTRSVTNYTRDWNWYTLGMKEILQMKGGVTTVTSALIVRDGKILLGLRNYTPDKWTGSFWTTPGGRCEEGEIVEDGLRRETLEETGITYLEIQEHLGVVDGAKNGDRVEVFLCSTDQQAKLMEPEKFSEWKWFTPNEIPENFINKTILKIIKESIALVPSKTTCQIKNYSTWLSSFFEVTQKFVLLRVHMLRRLLFLSFHKLLRLLVQSLCKHQIFLLWPF